MQLRKKKRKQYPFLDYNHFRIYSCFLCRVVLVVLVSALLTLG